MELTRKLKGPHFEKVAAKFLLGDNPSTYPSELIAHLYKQHPYLGKYQVNISVQGQDESQGYMYGVFLVSQPSDVPPPEGTQQMGQMISQGQPEPDPNNSVRIPIIVENKKAYSYDVFITPDGRFLPLNEMRVAAAMFDAGPYSIAPVPKALGASANQNVNPAEPEGMSGGGPLSPNQSVKQASAFAGVSLGKEVVEKFFNKIAASERLVDAADLNPAFSSVLSKLAHSVENQPVESAPTTSDFEAAVVCKVGGGYLIKTASSNGFEVSTHKLRNKDAATLPREVRNSVVKTGSVLLADNTEALPKIEVTKDLEVIDETGVFSVLDKYGSARRAAVITDVLTLDGRESDLRLVVGSSGAAFQAKVAGVRCGDLDLNALEGSAPIGEGVFVFKTAGKVSEPLTVNHAVTDANGETSYIYETPLQGRGTLKLASVRIPVGLGGRDFLIPEDSVFVPMTFNGSYRSDTTQIEKISARTDYINKVKIISDGTEFSFEGAPVKDLEKRAFLKLDEALLVLGVLGDSSEGAMTKLAHAADKGEEVFVASRRILAPTIELGSNDEAAQIASVIRMDLVKEAAVLNNSETVDSVLSLNFITPENVQGYLDALPVFEESASKLAELLVGVRLGLSDIPEPAVASSLSGMERAITGLKKLQIRSNTM